MFGKVDRELFANRGGRPELALASVLAQLMSLLTPATLRSFRQSQGSQGQVL